MPLTLLVLAAGLGTRYGGLKQLDTVGPHGETILDYSVHDAARAGFTRVVFVIRRDFAARFESEIAAPLRRRLEVGVVFQDAGDLPANSPSFPARTKPWGTGHAVWCARDAIDTPFAVINADDFYGRNSYAVLAHALCRPSPADGMREFFAVGYRLQNTLSANGTVSRGIMRITDGQLADVVETHGLAQTPRGICSHIPGFSAVLPGDTLVSMNCWGFTPALFPLLESRFSAFLAQPGADAGEFYLPAAVADIVQAREATVQVLETDELWFGVTYQQDRPAVSAALREQTAAGRYPAPLWSPS